MASKMTLSAADETRIKHIWEKLNVKYPEIGNSEFPLDFTYQDFLDEIILDMTPDVLPSEDKDRLFCE